MHHGNSVNSAISLQIPAMTMSSTLSALWVASALAIATTPVSAQASGNSSLQSCGNAAQNIFDGTAAYNATGTTSFSLPIAEDNWYLTQTLRDERGQNLYFGGSRSMQSFNVFLSVPDSFIGSRLGNATDYCVYLMYGRNETSDADPGDGNNSCEGVLSDECASALRAVPSPGSDSCPMPDVRDECGFAPWLTRSKSSSMPIVPKPSLLLMLVDHGLTFPPSRPE